MSSRVRLVLALHNHQPIGNFDGVFESAYRESYAPFLEILEQYPEIPISLHTSGSLLEWLVKHHPEYVERVRALVERGQVEIVGGPFFEPILATIPRRDRLGQIRAYTQYLERLFGVVVRGMWTPERVWEQSFVGDVTQAGIEYTILDDYHFRCAGLVDEELFGYYLTEDEGRLLKVFPGSEKLRYTIPFADPADTIDYLRQVGDRYPNSVVTFGDDGEKFGTWPGTQQHVYADGWLRRFFDALCENSSWLTMSTMAQVVDQVSPAGKVYIPDSSYREMTEWALPVARQLEYQHLTHGPAADESHAASRQFLRGGFWRNFRVKYPESNEMYSRMLQVSERLAELSVADDAEEQADLLEQARTELYRAQCNCSYWHGAFGGLYLPHLRNAVYQRLINADTLLERAAGRMGRWVAIDAHDYNLDARKEVRLAGDRLAAYFAPARGGHLYELDIRSISHNLLATLNRRPEVYHDRVREVGERPKTTESVTETGKPVSIHDLTAFKQPDLHLKLIYDSWPRKSCVDHFFQPGLTLARLRHGEGEIGDFHTGVYEATVRRSPDRGELRMTRRGGLGPYSVVVTKTVALKAGGSRLEIAYRLESLPRDVPLHFGVEFNFAGLASGADDRYFYDARGGQCGQLQSVLDLPAMSRIGLIDEWVGVDAALELSRPAKIWTMPVETISQSEAGFEGVFQSAAVIPHWEFTASNDGVFEVQIDLIIDTSAA
ncbi:MAG: DUF1926 domain-containing protein, partial [Planctomycetota bacterium]|nr:DUF1926 domain-containing protein [Planctomycetota bacterium]